MAKVSFSIIVALVAIFGMLVGLSVVAGSPAPMIGAPMLVLAGALVLAGPRWFRPTASSTPDRES